LAVKDKYCIFYFGLFDEFILQLIYLRPAIEKEFPGLELYIACKDEFYSQVQHHKNIVSYKDYNKTNFGCSKELLFDNVEHPILSLLEDSAITLKYLDRVEVKTDSKKCVILTSGVGAIKSLTAPEINKLQQMALLQGYDVEVNGDVVGASWVIGVENLKFYMAAIAGTRITLIPTGFGANFFQKAFPHGEIMSDLAK